MAYWRFISLAAIGTVIWITGLALLGRAVGSDWQSWKNKLDYVDYAAVVLAVCAIVYLIFRQRQRKRQRAAL
jgi:membrane protein DedA with SNARE-associated domain